MKLKKVKMLIFAGLLTFAFIACDNGAKTSTNNLEN